MFQKTLCCIVIIFTFSNEAVLTNQTSNSLFKAFLTFPKFTEGRCPGFTINFKLDYKPRSGEVFNANLEDSRRTTKLSCNYNNDIGTCTYKREFFDGKDFVGITVHSQYGDSTKIVAQKGKFVLNYQDVFGAFDLYDNNYELKWYLPFTVGLDGCTHGQSIGFHFSCNSDNDCGAYNNLSMECKDVSETNFNCESFGSTVVAHCMKRANYIIPFTKNITIVFDEDIEVIRCELKLKNMTGKTFKMRGRYTLNYLFSTEDPIDDFEWSPMSNFVNFVSSDITSAPISNPITEEDNLTYILLLALVGGTIFVFLVSVLAYRKQMNQNEQSDIVLPRGPVVNNGYNKDQQRSMSMAEILKHQEDQEEENNTISPRV